MQVRRMRPVAALTLAILAAPFLAATAVAAQSDTPSASGTRVAAVSWLSTTKGSVKKALDVITFAAAESIDAPSLKPAPALRAQAPPPPPAISDPATWIWPGDGPITSSFGRRWGRMHEGVDIDAAYGSAVVAAHRGTVTLAGWGLSGYGRMVIIDHGEGITSSYAHLASVGVTAGQVVHQGQQVGTVGRSGSVTAAHLHYEVRIHGAARNPATWLTSPLHSMAGNPG